jgi:hypothetical protein
MNQFASWGIAVAIVMAVVPGMFWLKGGKDQAKPVAIFFTSRIVGAISMFIKAKLVYKFWAHSIRPIYDPFVNR